MLGVHRMTTEAGKRATRALWGTGAADCAAVLNHIDVERVDILWVEERLKRLVRVLGIG
jgi:hypothetical protein